MQSIADGIFRKAGNNIFSTPKYRDSSKGGIFILKLLIVDDEEMEREGIRSICNWNELGIEIIGEAWNGKAALQLLEKENVDLIITDVKMPVMDGLSLAENVRKQSPATKIIFISGYEDFEAVRNAITINAFAYLLKPVNMGELLNVIKKAANIFLEDKYKHEEVAVLKKQLNESIPLLREKFFREVLLGITRLDTKKLLERARFLGIRIHPGKFCVSIIEINEFAQFCSTHSEEEIYTETLKLMNDINAQGRQIGDFPALGTHDGEFARLLYFPAILNDEEISHQAEVYGENILQRIRTNSSIDATIGLSSISSDLEMLPLLYQQARKAVHQKFYLGNNRVLWYEDKITPDMAMQPNLNEIIARLDEAISAANPKLVAEVVNNLFSEITTSQRMDKQYLQSICMQLVSSAIRILSENHESIENVLGTGVSPWSKIMHFETIPDIRNWISNCLRAIAEYLYNLRQDKNSVLIQQIKEIIHAGYENNLTIDDISRKVFMASGYIRRVFKNKTGITVQDYLVEYRMKKAMEMLKNTSLKVQDISTMVGYESASYFCSVFKEYYGVTPGEFRDGTKKS